MERNDVIAGIAAVIVGVLINLLLNIPISTMRYVVTFITIGVLYLAFRWLIDQLMPMTKKG